MYIILSKIITNAGEVGTKGALPCTAGSCVNHPSRMEINMEVSQNPQAASKLTSKRYLHINVF